MVFLRFFQLCTLELGMPCWNSWGLSQMEPREFVWPGIG